MIYVASIASSDLAVRPSRQAQIASLKVDKTSIAIPSEDADFADVFSPDLIVKLSEYTGINNHTIKLINGK